MSSTPNRPYPPVLIRAGEAERLDLIGHVLLADSSATAGALTSHRVALGRGADGAVPHRHDHSSELFYILDGAFDLLVDDNIVTARTGDLLVVPPGAPARVRRPSQLDRRGADHRHSRHRTIRLLPPRRPAPAGQRAARAAARAARPLRHPLPRQPRLATRPRGRLTAPGSEKLIAEAAGTRSAPPQPGARLRVALKQGHVMAGLCTDKAVAMPAGPAPTTATRPRLGGTVFTRVPPGGIRLRWGRRLAGSGTRRGPSPRRTH